MTIYQGGMQEAGIVSVLQVTKYLPQGRGQEAESPSTLSGECRAGKCHLLLRARDNRILI